MSNIPSVEKPHTLIEQVGFGLFDPASRANPYPIFHRLREHAPIYHGPGGVWILTRYADITAVLRDPQFGYKEPRALRTRELLVQKDHAGLLTDDTGRSVNSFLTQNPPEHTRLRKFVSPAFTARSVARLAQGVTEHADGLLDAVLDAGEADLVESFTYPLPFSMICGLLGIPAADRGMVQRWSHTITRGLDPDFLLSQDMISDRVYAMLDIAAYFRELAAERRRRPGEDLLSTLVAIEDDGDALTSAEVFSTCIMLLIAGHESTASLIAGGILALLEHPDQLARLYAEPDLVAGAVEELLRYDPPVQTVFRTALADVTLGETPVPAGTKVMSLLGAANRDPAEFPDPDRLDLTRTGIRQLAFSQGIHFCLGATLARLEAKIALRRLVERTSSVVLTGQPQWKPNFSLHGLATLPVTLHR